MITKAMQCYRIAAITYINQLSEVSSSEYKNIVKVCSLSDTLPKKKRTRVSTQ
jgi:hypothetical protein